MLIFAIALGAMFLVVVLLLSIPVDLVFTYESGDGSRSRIRIGWLFGLIGKELGGVKNGREKKLRGVKAKKGRSIRGPMTALRVRGFSGRLLLLARRLARLVQVRDVDVEFQVGTGDAAETGLLFAVVGPSLALASSFSSNIRIEPNFFEETFEGHARGAVRVYPIMLLPTLIAFVMSPATFRGVRALRGAR